MSDNHWMRIPPETEVESGMTWTIAVSAEQRSLGAVFVLLNRPCESLAALTTAEWMDLHSHIQRVGHALNDLFTPFSYEHVFLRHGVRQMYMEVVPRYRSPRTWRGETFEDDGQVPRSDRQRQPLSEEALAELRDAIRARLPNVV